MDELINQVAQALGGGAVVTALAFAARALWIAWTQRDERREREARAKAQSLDLGFARLLASSERQDAELARQEARITALSDQAEEDRSRIEALETSNRELTEENRTFRNLLMAIVEGLRRRPPDDSETLLQMILDKVPWLGTHPPKE